MSSGQPHTDTCSERSRRGSAVVETALVLPTLVLMLCGAADFARIFYAAIVVESAARAGVQYGSFSVGKSGAYGDITSASDADAAGQGLSGITTSVRTFCACNSGTAEVSCTVATCSGRVPNGYVESASRYTFTPLLPYPGLPTSTQITGVARFRVQ